MLRPKLIVLGLALLVHAPVWAEDTDAGWYLSGTKEAGNSSFWKKLESFDLPVDSHFPPMHSGAVPPLDGKKGLDLEGGFNINRFFSVELGYRNYGDADLLDFGCGDSASVSCLAGPAGSDTDLSSYSLSLVPRWPVNDSLSLYGKLGVVDWVIESDDFSELNYNNLQYGLGIRYDFSNDFGVMIEYEAVDTEQNATSVGLNWRF